jgi:hypothetical protein
VTPLIPFQKRERLICIEQLSRTFVSDEKRRPGSLRSASQNFKFQDCLALITEALRDSAAVSFVRFQKMLDLTNLNLSRNALHAHHDVVDEPILGVGS